MSFSEEIRREAAEHISAKTNAQVAALAVLTVNIGRLVQEEDGTASLYLRRGNAAALVKFFTLLRKTTNINFVFESSTDTAGRENRQGGRFRPFLLHSEEVREMAQLLDLEKDGSIPDPCGLVPWSLLSDDHCIRAYLRTMFVCCGTISTPERAYRLEFGGLQEAQAAQLAGLLQERGVPVHTARRRRNCVVYTTSADAIADLLSLMDIRNGLLEFQNARVAREVRGSVNRQVNCETANIMKTVAAAAQQRDDIVLLRETGRLSELPDSLRETAQARLAWPDLSLEDLGSRLDPPVGKSGINHRLRRLHKEAEEVRNRSVRGQETQHPRVQAGQAGGGMAREG